MNHVNPFKLLGCLLSESGGEFMIRFCGGFIRGQTGDMYKKPETEIEGFEKVEKVKKVEVPENGKWKISFSHVVCEWRSM